MRIRNGEVCYWPNLGYGRFGAKVTMDDAPLVRRTPISSTSARIRLADIDGSGTTDIIYLGRDGVRLYFNQSGNGWSARGRAAAVPAASITSAVDRGRRPARQRHGVPRVVVAAARRRAAGRCATST